MTAVEYLFVYGTLCRQADGRLNHLLAEDADYVGEAELAGKLYEIDGYPGAVLQPVGSGLMVRGELYRLLHPQPLFMRLDAYEECSERFPQPHEYRRSLETVRMSDSMVVKAWVYLYNHSLSGRQMIASGDYRLFRQQGFRA